MQRPQHLFDLFPRDMDPSGIIGRRRALRVAGAGCCSQAKRYPASPSLWSHVDSPLVPPAGTNRLPREHPREFRAVPAPMLAMEGIR